MLDLKRLKEARNKASMTQEDVAKIMGYDSPNTIANKEKGARKIYSDELYKLARLYDVSIEYLYGLVDEKDAHRITLSEDEVNLLRTYRKLSESERGMIKAVITTFIKGVDSDVNSV